ncbi:MAG: peptide deformylase [Actinomycetota bacterium]
MAILPIKRFGDPVLRDAARPVGRFDESLRKLADDMLETMYDAPGVGLAAPQVGVSLRLIVFDDGSGPRSLVNPDLFDPRGEQDGEEGCLSLPGLYFPVQRAAAIRVSGYEVDGTPVAFDAQDFMARILQHETDHVNGILFIDRLSAEDRREAMRLLREQELGLASRQGDPSRAL